MFKIFDFITEFVGALLIAASPILISIFIGFVLYYNFPSTFIFVVAVSIGIVVGVKLAVSKFKSKSGTIAFLSRTSATPDLDHLDSSKNEI